jgi:anti-anti-sigma regulatory factor
MEEPHPPPPDAGPIIGLLVIGGPIAAADVPRLCERLTAVIATSDADVVVCDVGDLPANTQTIETLARLQLTARRLQRRVRLQRASPDLQQVLAFVGLADVFPYSQRPAPKPAPGAELLRQGRRHPEQREHPLRVEERVDRRDPPV